MTETLPLRRFTDSGNERFKRMILEGKSNYQDLLGSPEATEDIKKSIEIELRPFRDREDAARHLDEALQKTGMSDEEIRRDYRMWSWLSCVWYDRFLYDEWKEFGHNTKKKKKPDLYVLLGIDPDEEVFRFYRHWLSGPWSILRAHQENLDAARILLCTPVYKPGDLAESLVATPEFATSHSIIRLAAHLYLDDKSSIKDGAAGKDDGCSRRLVAVLKQLQLTWDVTSMNPDDLVSLLGDEFNRFLK
jgi:hypothetical protein